MLRQIDNVEKRFNSLMFNSNNDDDDDQIVDIGENDDKIVDGNISEVGKSLMECYLLTGIAKLNGI